MDAAATSSSAPLHQGFLAVTDPATFHGEFLARNRKLLALMTEGRLAGRLAEARAEPAHYLDDAQGQVDKAVQAPA